MLGCCSCTSTLLVLGTTLFLALYAYIKWSLGFFKRRGVPTKPTNSPLGHLGPLFLRQSGFQDILKEHYDYLKEIKARFGGIYMSVAKVFVLRDPELIKNVLVKDFSHFTNHGLFLDEENDPLTGNLLTLENAEWKSLREKLTPTFTSGKMKMMFPIMTKCGEGLVDLVNELRAKNEVIDVKETVARYSTDIIMSAAFGIESNCLKVADTDFRKYGKMISETDGIQQIKNMIQAFVPRSFLKKIKFKLTKQPVEDFIMDLVKKTVNYRETNNVIRKDFMHLMLQLKNMGKLSDDDKISNGTFGEKGLSINQVAAQAFIFFLGGFETSSTLMTFALYELALNREIQQKLREEINSSINAHGGEMNYEAIMEMKYLDKVVNEALRKYPPIPSLLRVCNEDFKIPDSDVVIEKGYPVVIPVYGIHMDHDIYPNPTLFDPERFNEENKKNRPNYTHLPFGEGPRVCIGNRFGLLQTKVGIANIVKHFDITINSKTRVPIQFDKLEGILNPEGGMWLDMKKIE